MFLLFWDKKVAAVVIKASVYVGFSVVIWLVVWCICTSIRSFSDNFSYCMQMSSSFLGSFSFKALLKWGILGVWKDKYREKDKGRGGCGGQQDSFKGMK